MCVGLKPAAHVSIALKRIQLKSEGDNHFDPSQHPFVAQSSGCHHVSQCTGLIFEKHTRVGAGVVWCGGPGVNGEINIGGGT